METELALAVSVRDWADHLHRFLADHGGARVRLTAMGPEELVAERYDVLLIDDVCSFLTPRLVEQVRAKGHQVVGVYDPDEFADGKDRLLEAGVDDVVESGADADEFLKVIGRVASLAERMTLGHHLGGPGVAVTGDGPSPSSILVVAGPRGGPGITEVALEVARRLADRDGRTVLVDADLDAPSLAQRLGLPLHPNLYAAVDVHEHALGRLEPMLHAVGGSRLRVLTGVPGGAERSGLRARQVVEVTRRLAADGARVVVDAGSAAPAAGRGDPGAAVARALLESAGRVVGVGAATPVGVARLLEWVAAVHDLRAGAVDLLVNRAPRGRFRRGEIIDELGRLPRLASLAFLADDPSVGAAAWAGTLAPRGPFTASVRRWVERFVPAVKR